MFIVLLYWACLKLPGWLVPGTMYQMYIGMMSPMLWIALFLIWWLFFSRVRWVERFVGLIACGLIGTVAVRYLYDPTMRGDKPEDAMMGLMLNILPVVLTGWILWLLAGAAARMAGLACRVPVDLGRSPPCGSTASRAALTRSTASAGGRRPSRSCSPAGPPDNWPPGPSRTPLAAGRGGPGRLAGVPRPGPRRHPHGRPHRHRLEGPSAEGAVAPAGRARLVVGRGGRLPVVHARAAGRR